MIVPTSLLQRHALVVTSYIHPANAQFHSTRRSEFTSAKSSPPIEQADASADEHVYDLRWTYYLLEIGAETKTYSAAALSAVIHLLIDLVAGYVGLNTGYLNEQNIKRLQSELSRVQRDAYRLDSSWEIGNAPPPQSTSPRAFSSSSIHPASQRTDSTASSAATSQEDMPTKDAAKDVASTGGAPAEVPDTSGGTGTRPRLALSASMLKQHRLAPASEEASAPLPTRKNSRPFDVTMLKSVKLKRSEPPVKRTSSTQLGGMAGALQKALDAKFKNVRVNEDEDEDEENGQGVNTDKPVIRRRTTMTARKITRGDDEIDVDDFLDAGPKRFSEPHRPVSHSDFLQEVVAAAKLKNPSHER